MKGLIKNKETMTFQKGLVGIMIALISSLCLFGCGSEVKKEDPILMPTFAPTAIAPDRDTIYMLDVLKNNQDEILEIEVIANRIIAGSTVRAEFNVDFSGSVLEYSNFSEGNFLGFGEEEVEYKIETSKDNPNRVSVNISRKVPDNGVFGDGILMILKFKLVGIGASQLIFDNSTLYRQNGEKLDFIQWFGGTVVVQ